MRPDPLPPSGQPPRSRTRVPLRVLAIVAVAAVVVLASVLLIGGGEEPLTPGDPDAGRDPLAFTESETETLEARATAGLAHVLYEKSPGGAVASAERTARWRDEIEEAAATSDGIIDADTLEAVVLLESAGRPNARASDDLEGAAGLTQILAGTATDLLDMEVDVEASERLTRGILRGSKAESRRRVRRRVDERFDPEKALAGTVRYLRFAKEQLGRDDLALASYHMGVGNLQTALERFGDEDASYTELYFDSTPARHAEAYRFLQSLGDDSSTYLWRVYAARDLMARWRADPEALERYAKLMTAKNSAEEVLHPEGSTDIYSDPFDLGRAQAAGTLVRLDRERMEDHGLKIDPDMGELAPRLQQSKRLYRALRPEALAVLEYIGTGVRELSDAKTPLVVTSTARDLEYQEELVGENGEATRGYSLHTTGYAFDILREYSSDEQALAFQYFLDRLTALNLIAWVREPAAIHVTVSEAAGIALAEVE